MKSNIRLSIAAVPLAIGIADLSNGVLVKKKKTLISQIISDLWVQNKKDARFEFSLILTSYRYCLL
jgi:hypothetical protein